MTPTGSVSVLDFMAVANNSTSAAAMTNTAAFQQALDSGAATGVLTSVFVPAGTWFLSGTIYLSHNGTRLFGAGPNSTQIVIQSSNAPAIVINIPYNNNISSETNLVCSIGDLTVTRSNPPTLGGDGIVTTTILLYCYLYNIISIKNYNGFNLTSCSYGYILNCIAATCQNDGFYMSNLQPSGGTPPAIPIFQAQQLQWALVNTLSEGNNGNGYHVYSQYNIGITLASWNYPYSFGNKGNGIRLEGSSSDCSAGVGGGTDCSPISNFSVVGGVLVGDGSTSIYGNFNGGISAQILNCYIEDTGAENSGNSPSVGPTYTGYGIQITNVCDINISSTTVNQASQSGISILGNTIAKLQYVPMEVTIDGCRIINNNYVHLATGTGSYNGLDIFSPGAGVRCTITGSRIGNEISGYNYSGPNVETGNTTIGIAVAAGAIVSIVGNDLTGSSYFAYIPISSTNFSSLVISSNIGWVARKSGNVQISLPSSTNSQVVTGIGLAAVPNCVQLTATANLYTSSGVPVTLCVTAPTANGFTINWSGTLPNSYNGTSIYYFACCNTIE